MKRKIYIALDNKNLAFTTDEVEKFEAYWNQGVSIFTICKALNRSKIEIAVLILDRADKECIKPRGNGLYGEMEGAH